MIMLETATFVVGLGLASVSYADTPMQSMEQCQDYLQAQHARYERFLPKGSVKSTLKYRSVGTDYEVVRTCISY